MRCPWYCLASTLNLFINLLIESYKVNFTVSLKFYDRSYFAAFWIIIAMLFSLFSPDADRIPTFCITTFYKIVFIHILMYNMTVSCLMYCCKIMLVDKSMDLNEMSWFKGHTLSSPMYSIFQEFIACKLRWLCLYKTHKIEPMVDLFL